MDLINKFFDKVIIITLRERTDRQEYIRKTLKKMGVSYEFFYADKHPKGGVWGCYESHMKVAQMVRDNNWEYVMICEDDILPTKDYWEKKYWDKSFKFMKKNNNWELFYFGYSPCIDSKFKIEANYHFHVDDYIMKFSGCFLHCYAVQKRTIKKLCDFYEKNYKPNNDPIHIDFLIHQNLKNCYAIKPILISQDLTIPTSNGLVDPIEKIWRIIGSKFISQSVFLNCVNAFYSYKTHYFLMFIMLFIVLILYFKKTYLITK